MDVPAFRERLLRLAPKDPLVLAVSGGGDSVALALLVKEAGRQAVVAHLDHGRRPESPLDQAFVRALEQKSGFRHGEVDMRVAARRAGFPALLFHDPEDRSSPFHNSELIAAEWAGAPQPAVSRAARVKARGLVLAPGRRGWAAPGWAARAPVQRPEQAAAGAAAALVRAAHCAAAPAPGVLASAALAWAWKSGQGPAQGFRRARFAPGQGPQAPPLSPVPPVRELSAQA